MGTIERHQAPYLLTSERSSYYNGYPGDSREVIVETKKKPRVGKCTWILAAIFLLLILIIIICLIIFFTWGAAYVTGPAVQGGTVTSSPRTSELFFEQPGKIVGAPHFDLNLPGYVLNALKTGQPKACLLDAGYQESDYVKEHIPGARYFDVGKIYKTLVDGSVRLAHPLEFQSYARSLGIDKDCEVITYDHSDEPDSIALATFVWWLFKLYGHHSATVMNGGLNEWKKATANDPKYQAQSGGSAGTETNSVASGDFRAGWNPMWVITYPDVLKRAEERTAQIVDSRKPDEFSGAVKVDEARQGGRIRGAVNAPTTEILTKDGSMKNLQEIKDWLKTKNINGTRPVIVYDDTAVQASALYFAMVQAGYEARLYDDGWVEWAQKAPSELKQKG